jgi:hypothetical protein
VHSLDREERQSALGAYGLLARLKVLKLHDSLRIQRTL